MLPYSLGCDSALSLLQYSASRYDDLHQVTISKENSCFVVWFLGRVPAVANGGVWGYLHVNPGNMCFQRILTRKFVYFDHPVFV